MIAPKVIADDFLTSEERNSPVWQSVCQHLQRLLEKKRQENDNSDLTETQTATLRGHISCLKAVIALGRNPPETVVPNARLGPRVDLGAKYG